MLSVPSHDHHTHSLQPVLSMCTIPDLPKAAEDVDANVVVGVVAFEALLLSEGVVGPAD